MSDDELEFQVKIGGQTWKGKLHLSACVPETKPKPIFPEPYGEMLEITDLGTYWQIKPRQFLRTDDFSEIARLVKQFQGEYVSAGKSSHFRIPK